MLKTTVYIEADEIERLGPKTKCLECVLQNCDIQVDVEIDFDYSPGGDGGWNEPPRDSKAEHNSTKVVGFELHGEPEVNKSVEMLMTKEQREAIVQLAEDIIEREWKSKYEEEAFESLPDPDDHDDEDRYDRDDYYAQYEDNNY